MSASSYRVVQQVLRLVGEVAWLFAWSAAVGQWEGERTGPALPLWLLASLLVFGATLAGAITRQTTRMWAAFAISGVGLVASIGAGLLTVDLALGHLDLGLLARTAAGARAFVAGSLALVAWWRGTRLGANRPSSYEVEGQFRFGVLATAGLLAIVAILGAGGAPSSPTLVEPALVLVASGLLGVPLARIAEISASRRADSPRLTPSGPWLGTLLGVVGGLLLLTFVFAGVITVDRLGTAAALVLGALAQALWTLVLLLAMPVGYAVEWLVSVLRSKLTGKPPEPPALQQPSIDKLLGGSQAPRGIPPEVELVLEIVLSIAIGVAIVVLLARAIARRHSWRREADDVEELRESVFGWDTIRELLAWIRARLRRARAGAPAPGLDPDPLEPRTIREVYRAFLRLTAGLGFPRARSETPLEYASRLRIDRLEPPAEAGEGEESVGGAAVEALTGAYVQARYGRPEAPTDPSPAASALERLRGIWTGKRS